MITSKETVEKIISLMPDNYLQEKYTGLIIISFSLEKFDEHLLNLTAGAIMDYGTGFNNELTAVIIDRVLQKFIKEFNIDMDKLSSIKKITLN